jgi:hypothetical protein
MLMLRLAGVRLACQQRILKEAANEVEALR